MTEVFKKYFGLLPFLFMGSVTGMAMDTAPDDTHEHLLMYIESLLETGEFEDTGGQDELLERLELLSMHPVNLNRSSMEELRQLFMLNDIQLFNLLQHIETHGRLISIDELQSIEGFDRQTIAAILPFVYLGDTRDRRHFRFENMFRDGEQVLFVRYQQLMEEQKGFSPVNEEELEANPNARYLGSPYRLYTRYRFTWYRNISFGFTAEKDPGEEFFRGSQPYGFDFYSGHLHLQDFGRLKSLSVGDFQAQFGQGLCFWSGMGFGKSTEAIGIKKNAPGLRPYTSVDENNFLRGVGSSVHLGPLNVTAFISSKKRDANILTADAGDGKPVITSLQQSGFHRTPRELEGKHAVNERILGANVSYGHRRIELGLTAYHIHLDAHYNRQLSVYNQFDFSASSHAGMSFDYSFLARNLNLFGEMATDLNLRTAFLNGIMISLDRRLSFALAHRHYNKAYQAPFSAAFGENSRTANENGLYAAVEIRPSRRLRLYAYADHYAFPWMKHRTYMPSRGSDYLIHLEYRPMRGMEFYIRFRSKTGERNTGEAVAIRHLDGLVRRQYRLNAAYPISPSLSMRSRLELVTHSFGTEQQRGVLFYHDVLYRSLGSPFAITLRYALFDTDGYDARIYAYEHDVLYAFSFPFYSDKGIRTYVLVRYRLARPVDLYVRFAQTTYINRNSSGSGLDLVEGNTRSELKAQIRIRF
ncbi:MAG: helix-hairpin-helix domain-containing protein [Bacteroidales bacterium]|nr:helix-hairpin-helix domain-containing protein [Bacteroidales bacterium]